MKEIWKNIVGSGGQYLISNLGHVRSVSRTTRRLNRVLKTNPDKSGYLQVSIIKNGKRGTKRVHRLVAEAFIPNPDKKITINHIDGDKSNNRVENLEWATYRENNLHGFRNGLIKAASGERNGNSRLARRDVVGILILHHYGIQCADIAQIYQTRSGHVSKITGGSLWADVHTEFKRLLEKYITTEIQL